MATSAAAGTSAEDQELWSLDTPSFFHGAVALMYILAVVTAIAVSRTTAPYGRHVRRGWGWLMEVRDGWRVMESPALWAMLIVYTLGNHDHDPVPVFLLRLWQVHYTNRVIIYPWRMQVVGKGMPMIVVAAAFAFNIFNGYIQARQISHYGHYPSSRLRDPAFLLGLLLFLAGLAANFWADTVLLNLRSGPEERAYRIPTGFLFDHVSSPNYLCEMVEWLGWAVMTRSWAGLAFFVYTVANLAPRAASNHEWYRKKFADYPRSRRALVPFVW